SVGTATFIAGGSFSAAADSVEIGGNTVEIAGNSTVVKSLTGVKLSIADESLAVHPIYASNFINPVLSASLAATEATAVALESAASTAVVLAPAAAAVRALQVLLTAWSVAFNTSLSAHKVSAP